MIEQMTAWVPVTVEVLEDAVSLRAAVDEMFRIAELASRGFLGKVRCQRCHRPTRSVYTLVPVRGDYFRRVPQHFGSTCYKIVTQWRPT